MRTEQQRHAAKRPRHTHIFERDERDRYVEPLWVAARLFAVEHFDGPTHDPCCCTGTILRAAAAAGLDATGADIAPLSPEIAAVDFLKDTTRRLNIVFNPPYRDDSLQLFAAHALEVTERKVCMLAPLARLNAAHWLEVMPLRRIWLLTPRPSLPPHCVIMRGEKPKGGRPEYGWLVFERDYRGRPQLRWLKRGGRDAV